ncbi:MAG: cytochrome c oxidase subunit I, partial [Phycisphaerales bacterium]
FNLTFFTQFMLGSKGMPRRYQDYDGPNWSAAETELFRTYHFWSSIGSFIMAAGFFLIAFYLIHSLFRGKKAPANPWGGRSLEWQCASPPPHDNFSEPPHVADPYDFSVLEWDEQEQGYHWRRDLEHKPGEG